MPRGIRTEPKPHCPECGAPMVLRRPKPHQDWKPFWGCKLWPDCKGTLNIGEDGEPEELYPDEWDGPAPIDHEDLPY